MLEIVNTIFLTFFQRVADYLPSFFGGILIFAIGIVLSIILRKLLLSLLSFFRLELLLSRTRLMSQAEIGRAHV